MSMRRRELITQIFAFLVPIVPSAAMIVSADNSSKMDQRKIAQNIPLLGRHDEDLYEEICFIVESF